ncbi:MAG: Lrp/AsnC family transcriptional regulator [Thermoplasmata archaeon]|nr:MAG: Lrp/AsnC family transcriptional regulator [Thermoplasmata archaeon]
MDEKDRIIIDMLLKNARIPYTDIAKKLGVSETAVRKRIKKLEKERIIEGYTIKVNPSCLGYKSIAHVGIDTEPGHFLGVACRLTEMEEIKCVAITSGSNMIVADIWAKNNKHLSEIINKVSKIEGVVAAHPTIIVEMLKS